ncbi:MAG: alpha/beta fold hydrolase [Vicinamibacterales bacterium]
MNGAARDGRFRTSDGVEIAYTRHPARSEGAPRVALIHSLALDRSVWDGVVSRLDRNAEVLAYDCRGHGRSDRRADVPFTAELFARDLAELLDHAGWTSAVVGGCSMGGCVAMAFGGLYPQRTSGLLLVDTTAWYGPDAPQQFRARAEAARAGGLKGLVEFQRARWFSADFLSGHPALVAHATSVFLANDFDCYAHSCALLGDADLRRWLPGLTMPVSVVVGEEDQATPPAMARAIHDAVPQSTLTVLPRARHLTPIECPAPIAAALSTLAAPA